MSFTDDRILLMGNYKSLLNIKQEIAITIAPTLNVWIETKGYHWTLDIGWYGEFYGQLAIPQSVFNLIASGVLAGNLDRLFVSVKGGLWIDELATYSPERLTMTRYLRPGNGGRIDRPESALCKVTNIQMVYGKESRGELAKNADSQIDVKNTLIEIINGFSELRSEIKNDIPQSNFTIDRFGSNLLLLLILLSLLYIVFFRI